MVVSFLETTTQYVERTIFMKEFITNTKPITDKRILTSQNSPEIAERIKQASAEIMSNTAENIQLLLADSSPAHSHRRYIRL